MKYYFLLLYLIIVVFYSVSWAQEETNVNQFYIVKDVEKRKFDWFHGVQFKAFFYERIDITLNASLGIQTTYFQQAFYPTVGFRGGYRIWKPNERLLFFTGMRFDYMTYKIGAKQRIHQVESGIGYQLLYGNKLKLIQSSYINLGTERHSFAPYSWSYLGYGIEVGVCYGLF